jgi:tyrosinase
MFRTDLPVTRRTVMKRVGATIVGVAAVTQLSFATSFAACQHGMRTRRNINDAKFGKAAADSYREAVGKLKALGSSDSRNWLNLSDIHKNYCPHGNWYFLPWHRAYLLAIEDICAELVGDPMFALPYWDWSTFRQLPRSFVDDKTGGAANPLFHQARAMKKNDTLTSMLSPFGVDAEVIFGSKNIATILGQPSFQLFGTFKPTNQDSLDPTRWQRASGRKTKLESEPHDYLHGAVGGDMGDPTISPKDPIFYLHHCNIDRLWDLWRSNHSNESDQLWKDFTFKANFPAPDGSKGNDVVVSSLDTASGLCYAYDTTKAIASPFGPNPSPLIKTLGLGGLTGLAEFARANEAPVALSSEMRERVQDVITKPIASAEKVMAFIDNVEPPPNKNINVRVFLNCDYLTPLTPVDDPHYSGSFTFFVMEHHDSAQSFAIDLTDTIRNLQGSGLNQSELRVQLMPVTYDGKPAEGNSFKVGSIEIATVQA